MPEKEEQKQNESDNQENKTTTDAEENIPDRLYTNVQEGDHSKQSDKNQLFD